MTNLRLYSNKDVYNPCMSIPSLRPCMRDSATLLDDDLRNYGVICEDKAKRRNSKAKTKTFEENSYLLPYAVSSKEDTAYQRQLITRMRNCDEVVPYAYPWWKDKIVNSDLKRKGGSFFVCLNLKNLLVLNKTNSPFVVAVTVGGGGAEVMR
ncbi:hypothetical protein Tco_1469060 [Tanacetum coccineum]